MGPTLNVVVVRKSGQVSRFDYSAAMVNKDVIWMRITLFEYLEYLKKYVKGTKKVFAVLKKEQERFDFIKFIASSHTEAQSEASKQCPSLAKTFVVAVAATVTGFFSG
ncbi:hypothetical protein M3Y94_00946100 [Aphelenchoides besseyi]|nr:hypothetical protein M3Y94_00946100 [Aphelenchoides besseyi]